MNAEWLTIPEAAEILAVSSRTIRRWIKSGRLPAQLQRGPRGPQYFIPRAAVLSHRRAEEERTLRGLGLDSSEIARQMVEQLMPQISAQVETASEVWRRDMDARLRALEQRLETVQAEVAALRRAPEQE